MVWGRTRIAIPQLLTTPAGVKLRRVVVAATQLLMHTRGKLVAAAEATVQRPNSPCLLQGHACCQEAQHG